MDRRQLLTAGGLAGFHLAVDARRFFEGEGAPSKRGRSRPGPREFSDEPNMHREERDVDVLVAGGGLAGVCAALSAARNGAKTLLVQDRSRLGGNASSEIRMHIVGADHHGSRPGWREGGIIEELRLEDAAHNRQWSWEMLDLMLYDKCAREPNLELLLDAPLFGATVEGDRITEAHVRCDKTETIYRVRPKLCIDATGDGRLGLEAGAEYREGREPRATYGEKLALEEGDDQSQGCTILFTAREHDQPMPFVAPPWARDLTENDLLFRKPGGGFEYGYWWIELGGRDHDTIRENEALRFELLRVVMGVWDWIKNSGECPKSANWALETVGMIPGKRESRRFTGAHIQTQQDLEGGWRKRDDGVSIGGWPFDEHPPGGFDAWDEPPYYSRPIDDVYNIAFEALYSRNVSNLFFAGRNISNSHVAFTSTRVMATCACTGQAVGTAAALCAERESTPAVLRRDAMPELQQRLLRDDQSIREVRNEDPLDLARKATATANIARDDAPAAHVLDGQVRDVPGEWTHRWGAPCGEDGSADARLTLTWDAPVSLSTVQLTFDSGFHRELTHSASYGVRGRTVRGPQPETVRTYSLVAERSDGSTVVLAIVDDNYQRLRRHAFDPIPDVRLVHLHVTATNGSDHVRVFEVRAYA